MLRILSKKEAVEQVFEGKKVFATWNFNFYNRIEDLDFQKIRDEKEYYDNHIFFVTKTKEKNFKTVKNNYLNMERVTWEELRDTCIDYISGVPVKNSWFLVENEDEQDIRDSTYRITDISAMRFETLNKFKKYNVYKLKIKEG